MKIKVNVNGKEVAVSKELPDCRETMRIANGGHSLEQTLLCGYRTSVWLTRHKLLDLDFALAKPRLQTIAQQMTMDEAMEARRVVSNLLTMVEGIKHGREDGMMIEVIA